MSEPGLCRDAAPDKPLLWCTLTEGHAGDHYTTDGRGDLWLWPPSAPEQTAEEWMDGSNPYPPDPELRPRDGGFMAGAPGTASYREPKLSLPHVERREFTRADLEEPTLFACCKHCPEDEVYHSENAPDTHRIACPTCEDEAALEEPYPDALVDAVWKAIDVVLLGPDPTVRGFSLAAIEAVRRYDEEHHG